MTAIPDKPILEHFGGNADSWLARYRDRPSFRARLQVLRDALDAHAPHLVDRLVLDIGGGPGLFSELVARRGAIAICVDPSRAMAEAGLHQRELIDHLLEIEPKPSSGRVARVVGEDGAVSTAAHGCFDVVLAIAVVEYVDDGDRLLRRLVDLLRPGGILFVTIPDPKSIVRRVEDPFDRAAAALGKWLQVARLRDREYSALRPIPGPYAHIASSKIRELATIRLPLGMKAPRRWIAPSKLVVAEKQ